MYLLQMRQRSDSYFGLSLFKNIFLAMPLNTLRPGLNFLFKPEWGFSAFTDAYTHGIIGLQVV